MFPFRTKKSNLRHLNIFAVLWVAGVFLIGVPHAVKSWRQGRLYEILFVPGLLLAGGTVYGLNLLGLSLSYRERRRQATPEEIEEARRMLYGDKET